MDLRNVDPNGAFVEAVQQLVVSMMDPSGNKSGMMIPWRTGPDGEVGIPLRVVGEAAGRQVDELEEMLTGQTVMGEPALFIGRQGPYERLHIGAMSDEAAINLVALPTLIGRNVVELGARRCGKLIRIEAAVVAGLLERLTGVRETVASGGAVHV